MVPRANAADMAAVAMVVSRGVPFVSSVRLERVSSYRRVQPHPVERRDDTNTLDIVHVGIRLNRRGRGEKEREKKLTKAKEHEMGKKRCVTQGREPHPIQEDIPTTN